MCPLGSRRGGDQPGRWAFTCPCARAAPHKPDGVLTTSIAQGQHSGSEEQRKSCLLGCQSLGSSKDPAALRWSDFMGHEVRISPPLPHLREDRPLMGCSGGAWNSKGLRTPCPQLTWACLWPRAGSSPMQQAPARFSGWLAWRAVQQQLGADE